MNSIIFIICATGFFKKDHYLVSNTVQYDLNTMDRIPYDDCILISEIKKDSVQFSMYGHPVQFETEAEHVGIVRSTTGNLPHLLSRFAAHRSSLFKVLPVGAGKGHRGNPAACINAHQTYCYPVLFSGIPSLVLTNSEINILDHFFEVFLQRLQKLRDKTPDCVVMFLAGQLPGKAVLHLRLLSTFGMICRLPESFLHKIAEYQLTSAKQSSGSWFLQIRDICLMYNLPSPITLLQNTPTKYVYKKLVKSKVVDYWELNLRAEAENLKENSLKYFQADFMSLTTPHLIWSTCGSNPYEVHKAVIQAKMLSGRYVTDKLSRYWTQNKAGICSIPTCTGQDIGSLEHLLLFCPALSDARERMVELWQAVATEHQELHSIIYSVLSLRLLLLPSSHQTEAELWSPACVPPVLFNMQLVSLHA